MSWLASSIKVQSSDSAVYRGEDHLQTLHFRDDSEFEGYTLNVGNLDEISFCLTAQMHLK